MADLGSIGTKSLLTKVSNDLGPRVVFRGLVCSNQSMVHGAQDQSIGNPGASFRMDCRGVWNAWIPFPSGTNTIQVDVQQAVNLSPRPTLTVHADASVGINSDIVGTAGSSAGFVTIGPLTVSPSADAILLVTLANNYDGQFPGSPCYWDNLVVAP